MRDPQRSFIIYYLSMINDLVNRNKGFFNNIANQLGEMSNEIFKYFKLGFQPEPKAFKRTRNRWRRSGN